VKRDHPELVLLQSAATSFAIPHNTPDNIFSQREGSPLRDQRLRQAIAYSYDFEAYVDTVHNAKTFRDAGLPFEANMHSHIATQCENWIDPRNKDFGENSKYFMYNPAEAKKLIEASGFKGEIDFYYRNSSGYNFAGSAQIYQAMMEEVGLKIKGQALEPAGQWRNWKNEGSESYNGIFQNSVQAVNDDYLLSGKYTPGGKDKLSSKPIPGVTDRVLAIRGEQDYQKRNAAIKALVRDLAPMMLDRPMDSGNQKPYMLHWPWLKNYNVFGSPGFNFENTTGRPYTEYWYDASAKKS
jgi:ABC-type transport system substrate-binding protein